MALTKLEFTKNWENPTDFPTFVYNETQVREEMQLLFDEIRTALNNLIDDLEATTVDASGASNIGAEAITGVIGTTVQAVLESLASGQSGQAADINALVESITYDDETGDFTITKHDGTSTVIQTELEKVVTNFVYDQDTQSLILTYPDGSTTSIPLTSLIDEYDFEDTSSIEFTVANHKVKASLTTAYYNTLEGFKTDAEAAAANANTYAGNSSGSAAASAASATLSESYAHGGTESRQGENTDNAMYYAGQADTSATNAAASAGSAGDYVLMAEGYANGTQNGDPVGPSSPYWHNNAKYWEGEAEAVVGDPQPKITTTGILKGLGDGDITAAVAGADYQEPVPFKSTPSSNNKVLTETDVPTVPSVPTTSAMLKGDGAGNATVATAGNDYQAPLTPGTDYVQPNTLDDYQEILPASLNTLIKGTGVKGQLVNAEDGTDYVSPALFKSPPSVSNKAVTEKQIVNRNLLNNPYFRIDQRQGYVVPPNTEMFESGTVNTWTTDGYYQVTGWHYDASIPPVKYADIVVNGTTWSCDESYAVRGYVAIGGSTTRINDRWAIWIAEGGNGGVVILNNDDGTFTVKRISGTHSTVADNFSVFYRMSVEETKALRAQTVTISSKTDLGDLIFQHDVPSSGTTDSGYKFYPNSSPWALSFIVDNLNQGCIAINGYYVPLNSEITFSANMLEHGSISTMQAWLDSGAYDEVVDLMECQKYQIVIEEQGKVVGDLQMFSGSGDFAGWIPMALNMRTIPTIEKAENCYAAIEGSGHYPITSISSTTYGVYGAASTTVPVGTRAYLLVGDSGVTGRLILNANL